MPFPTVTATGLTVTSTAPLVLVDTDDNQLHRFLDGTLMLPKAGGGILKSTTNGSSWTDLHTTPWANNTAYSVGDSVINTGITPPSTSRDETSGYYQCLEAHTSPAGPTTMTQALAAASSRWGGRVGPAQGGHKMAIELGNDETISIRRTLVGDTNPYDNFALTSNNQWQTSDEIEITANIPLATGLAGDAGDTEDSMLFHHGLVHTPDGHLLATLYGCYIGDTQFADGYPTAFNFRKYRTIVLKSADQGVTWTTPVTVGYNEMLARGTNPDSQVRTYAAAPAITLEGMAEGELVYTLAGDLLCFMRSGSRNSFTEAYVPPTPLYMARSLDNGLSWDTPRYVVGLGSNPNAVQLASGVIILVYGHPGGRIVFSIDNGQTWIGDTQLTTSSNYIDIVALDHQTAGVVYYSGADNSWVFAEIKVTRPGYPILPEIFFVANPPFISSGQTTNLCIEAQNATNGLIYGGTFGSTGQSISTSLVTSVGPLTQSTNYRLKFESASDPGYYREKTITVNVSTQTKGNK